MRGREAFSILTLVEVRQPGEDGDESRARALLALVPALVHRLNNALLVVQGVVELGAHAGARDRVEAMAELAVLGQALGGLGELARRRTPRVELVDVERVLRACAALIEPLAEQRKLALETCVAPGLVVRADAGLPWLYLCALLERFGPEPRAGRLVLAAGARGPHAYLAFALSAARAGAAQPAEQLLARHVHALGGTVVVRARGAALVLRATLPRASSTGESACAPRARPRRVLLLAASGEERELVSLVLGEHGFRVHETPAEPHEGVFDLALVEERLALHDPGLCPRLCARFALERVELLAPRARPEELLARLRE